MALILAEGFDRFTLETRPMDEDEPFDRVMRRLDDIEAALQNLSALIKTLAVLLVEEDDEPDPAGMTLDGPIENATRDQDQPL